MFAFYFYSIVICLSVGHINGAEYMETKAAFIKTCELKDPKFVPCITKATQLLYDQVALGINGIDDLQFDPLKLKKLQVLSDNGPVSLNMTITKGLAIGLSNIVVIEADVDRMDYSWKSKLYIPKLRIEGNYRMQGRVLVLPLVGSGKCWFEASGMNLTFHIKTSLYEKFGHLFTNITGVEIKLKLSGLRLHFDNLFDGIKVLGDSTNQYLNENWREVSESIKPVISKSIEENFIGTLNKIYRFIPATFFISDLEYPFHGTTKNGKKIV